MYKEFFGLQQFPFNITPDPSFLFLPPKHRQALAGLTYAIAERKGFVVLSGDAGTGKTTLINSVLSRLPGDRVESSILLNPTLTPSEFLEGVLLDFDITDVPASKAQRLWKLQEFLARVNRENRLALLVIDEAHKLSLELLEEIRLLGNFENSVQKFLQILLVGQSELDDLLNRADLRQFKQRIALRLYIDQLSNAEVGEYIRFRWAKGGGQPPSPFTAGAIAGVSQWSHGIPRLVNSICDTALLLAYGEGSRSVGLNYVRAAALNLTLIEPGSVLTSGDVPNGVPGNSLETPQPVRPAAPETQDDSLLLSTLASYDDSKANLSLFHRLAEKFGIL